MSRSYSGSRRNPAYAAILRKRQEIFAFLPEWAHEANIKQGHYRVSPYDLRAAFFEWLDEKVPGAGEEGRQTIGPELWRRAFKEFFPRYKVVSHGPRRESWVLLNYQVQPKNPNHIRRRGVCPTCYQICLVPAEVQSKEQLVELMKALDQGGKK